MPRRAAQALAAPRVHAIALACLALGVVVLWPPFPFVLAALALVGTVVRFIHHRPSRGILVLVAIAPLDGLVDIAPDVPLLAGWKEGLLLFTLLAAYLAPAGERPAPRRTWQPAFLGLLALAVISVGAAPAGQRLWGMKIAFFYATITLVLRRQPLDARDRDRLITILMAQAPLLAAYGIAQQALGAERLVDMGYLYNEHVRFAAGHLRSFSTFNQPFPFAFYLFVVTVLCLPIALSHTHRRRNRLFLAALPVIAIGMAFTFVRTAWIATAIGVAVLALRGQRTVRRLVPTATVAAALAVVTVISLNPGVFSLHSLNEREATWSSNLGEIASAPLGHGIGSIGVAASSAQIQSVGLSEAVATASLSVTIIPDNQYYTWLHGLGLLGLWCFVRMLAGFMIVAQGASAIDDALSEGMFATLVGCCVAAFFANLFEMFPVDALLWTLVGVVTYYAPGTGSPPYDPRITPPTQATRLAKISS